MIDWFGVAFNALWILGLAVLLTVVSYGRWCALDRSVPVREVLERARLRQTVLAACILIGLGLQYQVCDTWWERGLLSMAVLVFGHRLMTVAVHPVVVPKSES